MGKAKKVSKILVTGGAGFIGSHLVQALARAGHSVRVLDDLSTGKRDRLAGIADLELLQGDIRNPAAVRRAVDGVEVIYHLAGVRAELDGDRPLWHAEEVNVGGALNLLEAARQVPAPRVVLASSGEVYGRAAAYLLHEEIAAVPATPEGVQMLSVEHQARLHWEAFRVPTVALRIFQTFGPGEGIDGLLPRLCLAALKGAAPQIEGEARHTRDLVYVGNVVAALMAAATAEGIEGQVFNVASGEASAIAQVWSLLCELAGKKRHSLEPQYIAPRCWEQTNVRVSIARACRAFDYTPSVRLRDGLAATLDSFRGLEAALPLQAEEHSWFAPPGEAVPRALAPVKKGWPAVDVPAPRPQTAGSNSSARLLMPRTAGSVSGPQPLASQAPAVTVTAAPSAATTSPGKSGSVSAPRPLPAAAANGSSNPRLTPPAIPALARPRESSSSGARIAPPPVPEAVRSTGVAATARRWPRAVRRGTPWSPMRAGSTLPPLLDGPGMGPGMGGYEIDELDADEMIEEDDAPAPHLPQRSGGQR